MDKLEYKGITIPEEIIIVEKESSDNNTPQGYVVPKGKNNILETAMNWAHWTEHERYLKDEEKNLWDWKISKEHQGIQHTYKNGTFKIKLYESAKKSCQGGKLSFWNCTIIAEDGKEFIIGINQNLLLNILLNSTVVNGEVQGNVWLGREKNNIGVYTPEMEDFKQAQKDEEIRNTKLSSNYQVGQMVKSKTEGDSIYLGTVWKYFDLEDDWRDITLTIYKKPQKAYVFYMEDSYLKYQIFNSKPKRIVTQNFKGINIEKCWQSIYDQYHRYDKKPDYTYNSYDGSSYYDDNGPLFDLQYSLELEDRPSQVLIEQVGEIEKDYHYYASQNGIKVIEN